MPRPLNRHQQLQNQAFLAELDATGNVREAARRIGVAYGTMQHRRANHPAFAALMDSAIAAAQARLNGDGGPKAPAPPPPRGKANGPAPHRTQGGETVVVRRNDGKLQVRAAQPGKLTRACEQAFLAALGATANIRLAAAAAGASHAAFYRRRRQNPAFAREMRLALEQGYDRVEQALLESSHPESYRDDAWRHNDPPAIPAMTFDQAFALLKHHQREVRLQDEPPHIKRRRGESGDAHSFRLAAMYRAGQARDREDYEIAEAARHEGPGGSRFEPPAPVLPDLDQVEQARRPRRGG